MSKQITITPDTFPSALAKGICNVYVDGKKVGIVFPGGKVFHFTSCSATATMGIGHSYGSTALEAIQKIVK